MVDVLEQLPVVNSIFLILEFLARLVAFDHARIVDPFEVLCGESIVHLLALWVRLRLGGFVFEEFIAL